MPKKILDRSPVRHWNAEPRLAFGICFCSYGFPVVSYGFPVVSYGLWFEKTQKFLLSVDFLEGSNFSDILYIKYKPDVGFIAV